MNEVLAIIGITLLLIVLLIVGVVCGSNYVGSYQCNNYHVVTGKETNWITLDACYVKTETGWQRWDEYKARAVASEGLKK